MRNRTNRDLPRTAIAAIALLLCRSPATAGQPAKAAPAPDPYTAAARATGVPLDLLVAVAGTESGFHPLALNVKGREIYCRSVAEAKRILSTTDNVDIGLMQINWPFWGRRLGVSKSDLLDPKSNLLYGARILKEPLTRGGDIWRRVSDYHAGSVTTRNLYNHKVYSVYLAYLNGRITRSPRAAAPRPGVERVSIGTGYAR